MVSDGCSKVLTYSDKCGFLNLSSKNYKFLITPIDNIRRDGDRNIISLPETVDNNTYIPLNLRETTNSSYIDNQLFGYVYMPKTERSSVAELATLLDD